MLMKIGNKEISELTDEEVILNYNSCLLAEANRAEASKNVKFDKNNQKNVGSLPASNPAFVERKEVLLAEIQKRKLEI